MQTVRVLDLIFLHLLHTPPLDPVCDTPKGRRAVIREASILKVRRREQPLQNLHECAKLAPTVISVAALRVTRLQRNGPLVEREVHIGGRIARFIVVCHGLIVCRWSRRINGLGRGDDLDDQARSEGRYMGDNHLLVGRWAAGGEGLVELGEVEGGDYRGDVDVVGEVKVEGSICGEGAIHPVEGRIYLSGTCWEIVEMTLCGILLACGHRLLVMMCRFEVKDLRRRA